MQHALVSIAVVTAISVLNFPPVHAQTLAGAPCVTVFDSLGTEVGPAHLISKGGSFYEAIVSFELDGNGTVTTLFVSKTFLRPSNSGDTASPTLYYPEPDTSCSGTAWIAAEPTLARRSVLNGQTLYVAQDGASPTSIMIGSLKTDGGACGAAGGETSAYPTDEFAMPAFTPPFHLESVSCFSPAALPAATLPELLAFAAAVSASAAWFLRRSLRAERRG